MKHFKKTTLASAVSLYLLAGGAAIAGSWTVTQKFTVNMNATMVQTQGSSGAVQTMNSINLNTINGTLLFGSQTVTMDGATLTLTQNGNSINGKQAVNRISAYTVTAATQDFLSNKLTRLIQDNTGGGNTQVVNDVAVTDTIIALTQTAILSADTGTFTLEQGRINGTGGNNVQAVNNVSGIGTRLNTLIQKVNPGGNVTVTLLQDRNAGVNDEQVLNRLSSRSIVGDVAGLVLQEVNGSGVSLDFDQNSVAAKMIQAANLIKADATSNTVDAVKQVVSVNNVNFDQLDTTSAFQLGNGLVSANLTGGTMRQAFTAFTVALVQSNAAGSVQSGNYVGMAP
jgi:hypothetical protein